MTHDVVTVVHGDMTHMTVVHDVTHDDVTVVHDDMTHDIML